MIDKVVTDPAAALEGIRDGASIMVSGFGGAGIPVVLIRALEASGARELTIVINSLRLIHAHAPRLFGEGRVRRAGSDRSPDPARPTPSSSMPAAARSPCDRERRSWIPPRPS